MSQGDHGLVEEEKVAHVQPRHDGKTHDDQVDTASGGLAMLAGAESRKLVVKLQSAADKLDAAIGDTSSGGAASLAPRLNELATDISATSRQLNRVLKLIEESPQSLVFGAPALPPGPGEPGFVPPTAAGAPSR